MTPQEEKEFFQKLEQQFPKPAPEVEATILRQEDFEYIVDTLGRCIRATPERDALLRALKRSHKDLFQLFMDLKALTENNTKGTDGGLTNPQ